VTGRTFLGSALCPRVGQGAILSLECLENAVDGFYRKAL